MNVIRNVPFFDYPQVYLRDKENLLRVFDDVCSRGAFILQKDKTEFEINLSKFVKSSYSIGVGNATDGLEICCLAMKLKPGDEIICSSHTMIATASSIKFAGGIPVPVDIGQDGLIDPESIIEHITKNTVGIMPTQLNGRTCDMEKIISICKKYNLFLIEDAAQSLGSKFKEKNAGTFGEAGVISFFPAKVLGSLGDAGGIITNDPNLYDKMYQLHDHGRNPDGELKNWGKNSRLDNLQAAFLNHNLKFHNNVIERRREIARIYNHRLSDLNEITLPPGPDDSVNHFDIYQNYEIQADNRDQLKNFLKINGIGTLIQWGGKGVHQWNELNFNVSLPNVESFFQNCIMLPMNFFLNDDDIHYICDNVFKFYRN